MPYESVESDTAGLAAKLDKLVVLKLNGGLGTSMGCVGPKSAISVRNDLTFLDLCVRQIEVRCDPSLCSVGVSPPAAPVALVFPTAVLIYPRAAAALLSLIYLQSFTSRIQHLNEQHNVDVPLVLMNSFNTDEDTIKILRKYAQKRVNVMTFNQSRFPRILKETLQPLPKDNSDSSEWCVGTTVALLLDTSSAPLLRLRRPRCQLTISRTFTRHRYPPGHGDLYKALYTSGTLQKLLDAVRTGTGATVAP